MSQNPGAGSAAATATSVSSSPCQELSMREVRGPEEDVSLRRAPSEGAEARVPRGAGSARKVEAEPSSAGGGAGGGQRRCGCA